MEARAFPGQLDAFQTLPASTSPPIDTSCFISVFKKLSHLSATDRCSLYFGCSSKVTPDPLFL